MRILFALFFSIRLSAALAMSKDIYSLRQLHYEAAAKKDTSKGFGRIWKLKMLNPIHFFNVIREWLF